MRRLEAVKTASFIHTMRRTFLIKIAENHKQKDCDLTAIAVHFPSSFPLFMAVLKKKNFLTSKLLLTTIIM